ncbi:excalibur calcium-binding domain-containing protein [Streptomyces clavuligerus]|uniref:Excalibur domain protein n=2 Tax=Streptomyces clavuligerus TaxID=1901 RepID=B5GTH8_STRCL|nr:excalibur calcium-binding domain-containing protein [Streptomyces clavuligerus]ANW19447.1 hypothetical protein BB341_15085 [Streptomyces clavuligerus]AXU14053.1 hypothetical protein D1794_15730 [Streptomyces clavuligerus]EDY49572.1 hypothetical protein SSCG_02600 [Streptomyces clavuligerus]EFG07757.1 Excalibur domain protein [Streptomyces clavuligerus]MBY6304036.1 excalibur calcium-binding domain-containing protein [Streptomyces clavuligerus]
MAPPPEFQPAPPQRPLWKMKRLYAGGALVMLLGFGCGATASGDDATSASAKSRPGPTTTVRATVTATATAPAAPAPRTTITEPGPTVTVTATKTAKPRAYSGGTTTDTGDTATDSGANVYYRNCAAARAAGAAPVHRGDPGYGRHLDRDNDGTGCDWG